MMESLEFSLKVTDPGKVARAAPSIKRFIGDSANSWLSDKSYKKWTVI